ncbi:MAG: GTP 3',8-cyclase [candidate division WS2 bacterium]|nr:GTP 3',8-cyclase [Candidatus Psychracetigena formicireducens]
MKRYSQEIRFLLTQRCTHKCYFCHGEGLQEQKPDLLDADDVSFIFNTARLKMGFESTTLSGGEPLIRSDVLDIARKLHENLGTITLTTNGFLLDKKIYIGNYLDRVNVSIHSLNEKTYAALSGKEDAFHVVVYGLRKLRNCFPDLDIRINTTLIKGVNSDKKSINELLSFASCLGASIKFIEMYPATAKQFVSIDEVADLLLKQNFTQIVSTTRKKNYYNGMLEVGLTRIFCATIELQPDPSTFCLKNNDLFIAPDGTIKPCRHLSVEVNILSETKNRDVDGLHLKLLQALKVWTNGCVILQSK